ncbi:MAG: aldose 1-epimerase, partial [Acidobacteria bacterium]|nr:aldose 1-epimerase [Acidobacteriota bacterium]
PPDLRRGARKTSKSHTAAGCGLPSASGSWYCGRDVRAPSGSAIGNSGVTNSRPAVDFADQSRATYAMMGAISDKGTFRMMRTVWRRSGACVLLLCLQPGLQGKDTTRSPKKTMNNKLFSAAVERDTKTGWSIAVLKYSDPSDAARSLEARIVPEAGSNLYSLKIGGTELLVQPTEWGTTPSLRYGFPVLFPTPNRVRDSKFIFDGHTYSFPPNERTNFIHGLVHKLAWQAGTASADKKSAAVESYLDWDSSQEGFKLFPIKHRLSLRFTLDAQGVKLAFTVENRDAKRLPFGFAFHPWFQILGSRAETYLRVPAQKHMEAEGLLPTGKLEDLQGTPYDLREPVSLEALKLDDVYWGLTPERIPGYEARDKGVKVSLGASPEFTHMVVYTPPGRPFFCMENQTCSTDAHNLHAKGLEKEAHLLIVEKGKKVSGWVYVKVERKQ